MGEPAAKDLSPQEFLQLLEETKQEVETRYPSHLHPIYVREPELLAQELERRAKSYGKNFRDILFTAAHLLRLPPHD